MKKQSKSGIIVMLTLFLFLNGVVLYIISLFWDLKFTIVFATFLGFMLIIEVVRRFRLYRTEMRIRRQEQINQLQMKKQRELKAQRKQKALEEHRKRVERENKNKRR